MKLHNQDRLDKLATAYQIFNISNLNEASNVSLPVLSENTGIIANDIQFGELIEETSLEWERALLILKANGYESKVFCNADAKNPKSEFEVVSDKWAWHVSSLSKTDPVPSRYLEGVLLLAHHNVKIDAIAIAKPIGGEVTGEVIRQEIKEEVAHLFQVISTIALITLFVLGSSIGAIANSSGNTSSVRSVDIPDPVLLVKVNNMWIEVGRWI